MPRYRLIAGLMFLLAMLATQAAHAVALIALSEGGKEYAEAAEVIRHQLQQSPGGEVHIKSWQEIISSSISGISIVVSVGSPAFAGLMDTAASGRWGKTPVIATMLTRSSYDSLRRRSSASTSAVVLDQPLARQFALMRNAFPGLNKVGILLGPDSRALQNAIEKAATDNGLVTNVYRVDNEQSLTASLTRLLDENELLFAVPDPLVFNSNSVQNILLATYRQRIPMMGFSPAYVRAGAVVGLYSTPTQIATQAAKMARAVIAGQALPPPQAPVEFQVGVNANVARSLGFRLSEDALRMDLMSKEGL